MESDENDIGILAQAMSPKSASIYYGGYTLHMILLFIFFFFLRILKKLF